MSRNFRVALLIECSRMYGRELLRGISSFGHERGDWRFFHEERSLGDEAPPRLKQWQPHGIIARLTGAKLIRQIRQMAVPTVNLYHEDETQGIPGVALDQDALVRMAIGHFVERRFRNFAYVGFANVLFSRLREARYVQQLAAQGFRAATFHYPPLTKPQGLAAIERHAMEHAPQLAKWLRDLPKPMALFACNDMRGLQVLTVCREAGIAVPDEVAVLGVDNDDVQCDLSDPPLSSIDPNAQASGYRAAALLQDLLDGQPPPPRRIQVEPLRLVTRRSTDVLAVADPDVAAAVRFVREHACAGAGPEAMRKALGYSRSTLERWFQQCLGHSLMDEILRLRIHRAAELLTTTDLKVERIAHLCGFAHVESMSRIFRRLKGAPPGQYRAQHGTRASTHANLNTNTQ